MRFRPILSALALTAVVTAAHPAAAQDTNSQIDGLNADLRQLLYNGSTSLVAKLDLSQLGHDQLLQTYRSLFDPSEYAILVNSTKGFEQGIDQAISGPSAATAALLPANYKALTVVVLQYLGGVAAYSALPIGFNVDDSTFALGSVLNRDSV